MAEISKTVDHALRLLVLLGEKGPCSPAELARAADLNRTVVHRLLTTLHQRGFVTRTEAGYVPGAVLVLMAGRVSPELRAAARPAMTRLAEQAAETVVLHTLDANDAVVLDEVVAVTKLVRVKHEVGSSHPIEGGASGRALLAFLDDAAINRVMGRQSDPEALRVELQRVRELGYALSHDELQDGVHGVAVPVRDAGGGAVASLAVLVPATRATDMEQYLSGLFTASEEIAEHLRDGERGAAAVISTAAG